MDRTAPQRLEPPRLDDAELVSRLLVAREIDERNGYYRSLVERYWRVVVLRVKPRVKNMADAEDVAQEAFIRAWRAIDRLENPRLFLGWLLRIAANAATDHLRKRRPTAPIESCRLEGSGSTEGIAREWRPDHPTIEQQAERDDEWNRVLGAVGDLPDRYQTVVTLRYLEGLSNQAIAEALGEPEGTVRNRIFRALRKLRSQLEGRETKQS